MVMLAKLGREEFNCQKQKVYWNYFHDCQQNKRTDQDLLDQTWASSSADEAQKYVADWM
jgi:hypothetical protein